MSLAEHQARFFALVTGRGALADAAALVSPSARQPPEARVAIYRDMYRWRLIDALREDFPHLARLLGDEGFYALADAYIDTYPSTSPSLAPLGHALVAFFESRVRAGWTPPGAGAAVEARRPDLVSLARLEWARSEVFDRADAEPVDPRALATLQPDALASARFELVPALAHLALDFDVVPLWRALEDESVVLPPPRPAETHVAVFRREFVVHHTALSAEAAVALSAAERGATLSEMCEAFTSAASPVAAAFNAIGAWLADGWVREIRV